MIVPSSIIEHAHGARPRRSLGDAEACRSCAFSAGTCLADEVPRMGAPQPSAPKREDKIKTNFIR
jgi:hypothetical protein